MPGLISEDLTVAERRAEARERHGIADFMGNGQMSDSHIFRDFEDEGRARLCAYCLAPLANGAAYCSEECEDGAWQIMPTVDGEV